MEDTQAFRAASEQISKTVQLNVGHGPDLIHGLIGLIFFAIGICGIWLHGLNGKRLVKLDLVLPQGFVSLHFHLALANLGVIVGFLFGGLSTLANRWIFGYIGCQVYAFEGMICGLASIIIPCVICILQYAEIKFGLKLRGAIYHSIAMACWTFCFFWAFLPILGFGNYTLEPHQTSCALDMTNTSHSSVFYLVLLSLFGYVIPITAAIFSFVTVWFTLTTEGHQESNTLNQQPAENSWTGSLYSMMGYVYVQSIPVENSKTKPTEQKVFLCTKLNGKILLLTLLTWLPLVVFSACSILYGKLGWNPMVYYFPQLIAKLGCSLMPLTYASILNSLQRQRSSVQLNELGNKNE